MNQNDIDVLCDVIRTLGRDKRYSFIFDEQGIVVRVYTDGALVVGARSNGTSTEFTTFGNYRVNL